MLRWVTALSRRVVLRPDGRVLRVGLLSVTAHLRHCSTTTATGMPPPSPDAAAAAAGTPDRTSSNDWQRALAEEIDLLVEVPLPIGTLYRTLSTESRKALSDAQMPLESFLLRHPARYSVFKAYGSAAIMISRFGAAPETAAHAKEKNVTDIFNGAVKPKTDFRNQKIYTVLKYVPNEWSSYTDLPIPEDVKKRCIGKPPKRFFESNPRYFDVRFNALRAHTFEVRRSEGLQRYVASQQQGQPPPQ